MDNTLELIRKLSKESHAGLGFCYKWLKRFDFDYEKALAYLKSDAFKRSYETHRRYEDKDKKLAVNGKEYELLKLLGKGKGGYSFLAEDGVKKYVLKQIHHEPCDYYQFGNKIEAEINDYERLRKTGIRMPAMIDVDIENERILKEFIEGDTIYELVLQDRMKPAYIGQVRRMCTLLQDVHLNIDYFPTNFVVQNEEIYYIDFECNEYMEKWNFENWGIKYWSKTPEFLQYMKEHS